MRIATWNLERGGRTRAAGPAQRDALRELAADVMALTEPPASLKAAPGVIASPPRRAGADGDESWVAITSTTADLEPIDVGIPYERMSVAARATLGAERVVVYCAVLPWLAVTNHAPYLVQPGETAMAVFDRVLREQVDDILTLRQRFHEPVIWAGDFNQSLEGPLAGCSRAGRLLLRSALDALGYAAWNATSAHARDGLCAVDLICGPRDLTIRASGRAIAPMRALRTLRRDAFHVRLQRQEVSQAPRGPRRARHRRRDLQARSPPPRSPRSPLPHRSPPEGDHRGLLRHRRGAHAAQIPRYPRHPRPPQLRRALREGREDLRREARRPQIRR